MPHSQIILRQELLRKAQENNLGAVQDLLAQGASTDAVEAKTGNTALHFAALHKNARMIKALLFYSAKTTAKNNSLIQPIDLLVTNDEPMQESWDCMNEFAKYPVDRKDSSQYNLALQIAARYNQTDLVCAFLIAGAYPNYYGSPKLTDTRQALDWAVHHQNAKMIFLLLRYNADRHRIYDGRTAFQTAIELNYFACVREFIKFPDSNVKEFYARALLRAAYNNLFPLAKALLVAGAKTYWYTSDDGNTALHWAVYRNNFPLVQELISYDANRYIENLKGLIPLELAKQLQASECVEILNEGHVHGVFTLLAKNSKPNLPALRAEENNYSFANVIKSDSNYFTDYAIKYQQAKEYGRALLYSVMAMLANPRAKDTFYKYIVTLEPNKPWSQKKTNALRIFLLECLTPDSDGENFLEKLVKAHGRHVVDIYEFFLLVAEIKPASPEVKNKITESLIADYNQRTVSKAGGEGAIQRTKTFIQTFLMRVHMPAPTLASTPASNIPLSANPYGLFNQQGDEKSDGNAIEIELLPLSSLPSVSRAGVNGSRQGRS